MHCRGPVERRPHTNLTHIHDRDPNFLGAGDEKPIMDPVPGDAELIAASSENPQAFVGIYRRHYAAVHNYLRRRVGRELADDLTAEVFLRAWKNVSTYEPSLETAVPWLYGIATHLIADHRRAEKKQLALLDTMSRRREPPSAEAPEARLDRHAITAALADALRRLRPPDRDAFLLVFWGDLSYEEAAAALDVPVGTLRSRVHRARHRLAAELGARPGVRSISEEAHA